MAKATAVRAPTSARAKPKVAPAIPKSLGECADILYTTRAERLSENQNVKILKAFEELVKNHIIDELPASNAEGITGKVATATIVRSVIPIVEDWDKLYAYIKKNNRFDLLQRRLNETAVEEMWDAKKTIPGVGSFNVKTVSVTKK